MKTLFRVIVVVVSMIILQITASADIREAEKPIVDTSIQKVLELIPESGIGLPSSLQTKEDVYVFISSGGAFTGVRLIGKNGVSPQELAKVLETAVDGTILSRKPVLWSDDEYPAAIARYANGKLGALHASVVVPEGKIVSGIRVAGFRPHVLLRIRKYAETDSMKPALYSTRSYNWYNESSADDDRQISVRVSLPRNSILIALFFMFFVPLLVLLSIATGIIIAKNERMPIANRRTIYRKVVLWPVFGGIAIHMPFSFMIIRSGQINAFVDIWFGNSSAVGVIMPYMMIPFPFLLIAVIGGTLIERKLFGPAEPDKDLPQPTEKEKALNKKIAIVSLILLLIGFGLLYVRLSVLPSNHPLQNHLRIINLLIFFAGPHLVRFAFKKQLKQVEAEAADLSAHDIDASRLAAETEQIKSNAHRIAKEMGVELKEIDIDESLDGRRYASAMAIVGNHVKISRMAMEVLSPEEMDFILAHEIAHIREKHIIKQISILLISPILLFFPLLLRIIGVRLNASLFSDFMIFSLPVLGFVTMFGVVFWLSKRREYQADRLALLQTRNLQAAQSALVNMMRRTPLPYIHEIDDVSTHPRLSKRLNALKKIAGEIGLPVADYDTMSIG